MIDIHCHILPAVDDGSEDLATSLGMARMAAASGVKTIVATPHCNLPFASHKNYISYELRDRFVSLSVAIAREKIPLTILPGAEVMCTPELPELLEQHLLLGLGGSHYLLVEFLFDETPSFMWEMLHHVKCHGFTPVVAHPERYDAVQLEPRIVYDWLENGCLLQVNKDSILGNFGPRPELAVDWLLSRKLPHAVASDAHGIFSRTTEMQSLHNYLIQAYGAAYTEVLMNKNPGRIIADQPVISMR